MKRILSLIVLLAIIIFGAWFFLRPKGSQKNSDKEPSAVKIGKHSQEFNDRVSTMVANYMLLRDALVDWDSVKAGNQAGTLMKTLTDFSFDGFGNDDPAVTGTIKQQLSDVNSSLEPISKGEDLVSMRQDFSSVSENLYPFLKTIGYEGKTLYWENCPMAFGEGQGANWLSNSPEIENPYLGNKHPIYKSAMVNCGEVKDSLVAK